MRAPGVFLTIFQTYVLLMFRKSTKQQKQLKVVGFFPYAILMRNPGLFTHMYFWWGASLTLLTLLTRLTLLTLLP